MRTSTVERNTNETKIKLTLNIDGSGEAKIKSGIGFLDHMLNLFAAHGSFDLNVDCDGDTFVDDHHSVEDIGICLGMAIKECIADKKGIMRYGSMLLPMDEALVLCALDISGRSYLAFDCNFPSEKIGSFDTELVNEFFAALARTAGGIDLDYCDIERFALESNRDRSVVFEIASKYFTSDSFVDHDGHSISSEGFLPTVVDIMVI